MRKITGPLRQHLDAMTEEDRGVFVRCVIGWLLNEGDMRTLRMMLTDFASDSECLRFQEILVETFYKEDLRGEYLTLLRKQHAVQVKVLAEAEAAQEATLRRRFDQMMGSGLSREGRPLE